MSIGMIIVLIATSLPILLPLIIWGVSEAIYKRRRRKEINAYVARFDYVENPDALETHSGGGCSKKFVKVISLDEEEVAIKIESEKELRGEEWANCQDVETAQRISNLNSCLQATRKSEEKRTQVMLIDVRTHTRDRFKYYGTAERIESCFAGLGPFYLYLFREGYNPILEYVEQQLTIFATSYYRLIIETSSKGSS